MINKLSQLKKLHIEIINLINREYTTSEIEIKLSIKRRDLIKEYHRLLVNSKHILTTREYQSILNEYLANYCFKEFSEGKIAIISDTHLASKHENLEYLKQVRDFLVEKEIRFLLHGGDIGDGLVEYHKKYSTYPTQLDHILNVYDLGTNTKQYILGGNHDIRYKRKDKAFDILNLLEENNHNITAIGYYQAYFKLGSSVFSFEHSSRYEKRFAYRNFSILGHSHCLKYKQSTVILPTLSDSFPTSQQPNIPGFVVLDYKIENNHSTIKFSDYMTTKNGIETGKEKIYRLR